MGEKGAYCVRPILIVDDEAAIAELVRRTLAEAGYPCRAVTDGAEAADLLEAEKFDLLILDVMMPEVDGYELLRWARPTGVPVIFLTARGGTADKVRGLRLGADDYIVKPFDPPELVARVESVLRRAGRGALTLTAWDVAVDTGACTVTRGGTPVPLTPKEYDLLLLLLRNRGHVLYRTYLYETVWGEEEFGQSTRTLDTHIKLLRKTLGPYSGRIVTLRGVGYRFEA